MATRSVNEAYQGDGKDFARAPFSYYGGKTHASGIIWKLLGDVDSYVEPFMGSLGCLLQRPHYPFKTSRLETVNDIDGYVSNYWRAVKYDPESVVHHAQFPVSERDIQARHYWLVTQGKETIAKMHGDPEAFCAKTAGYWMYGKAAWIGRGFCEGRGPWKWGGPNGNARAKNAKQAWKDVFLTCTPLDKGCIVPMWISMRG